MAEDGMTRGGGVRPRAGLDLDRDASLRRSQDVIDSHASALSELAQAISDTSLAHLRVEEEPSSAVSDGEEHALETHEVVELQAYDERKWITEQIDVRSCAYTTISRLTCTRHQFLEHLPPIDVFVGVEPTHQPSTPLPVFPQREELQAWVAEQVKTHDAIDKQAESLERGKLRKLKKLTAGRPPLRPSLAACR
jgi:hypothetical protein